MVVEVETKKCTKCPEGENIKPITDFYVCKGGKIRSSCKKCDNEMSRAYKARSKKHISKYNKKYKEEHRDEISVYNHDYNKNNREAIQSRQTRTRRIRRASDFNFYLATDLRSRLCDYIGSNGSKCKYIIEPIIGCEWNAFTVWLEYQFDDEMWYDNYGEYWTIDHVYPVCEFDLTNQDDMDICFNWRNLRPITKEGNNKKVNKIIPSVLEEHLENVKVFWEYLPEEEKDNYT